MILYAADHPLAAAQGTVGGMIEVQVTKPVIPAHQLYPKLLLRVRSLTGQPVRIAAPIFHEGWSAYTSGGVNCTRILADNLPMLTSRGELAGSTSFTAGANAPALIPLDIYCTGIRRGEQLSMNIILMVEQNGRWLPKHVAMEEKTIG